MKKAVLNGLAFLVMAGLCATGVAQTQTSSSIQFNVEPRFSRLLGVEHPVNVNHLNALDLGFGLTGRIALNERLGFRAGASLRTTRFRYAAALPPSFDLPDDAVYVVDRKTYGIDLPLVFDTRLAAGKAGELRWLFGAGIHIDFEKYDDYFMLPEGFHPQAATTNAVSLSLISGFEWWLPITDSHRIAVAPQVGLGMPDRSTYAFNDQSPAVSLMTGSVRFTFEMAQRETPRGSGEENRDRNGWFIGYGGKSYVQSLHLGYERLLLNHKPFRVFANASGGYGLLGSFATLGATAAIGGEVNAVDVGLSAGYSGALNALMPVPEVGYRYTPKSGFTARIYSAYWPEMQFLTPATIGVSLGKRF